MIGWRCRLCGTRGYDMPGLAGFWSHWLAWHIIPGRGPHFIPTTTAALRPSIWDRTR